MQGEKKIHIQVKCRERPKEIEMNSVRDYKMSLNDDQNLVHNTIFVNYVPIFQLNVSSLLNSLIPPVKTYPWIPATPIRPEEMPHSDLEEGKSRSMADTDSLSFGTRDPTFLGDGLRATQVDVDSITKWSHSLSCPQQYFRVVGTKLWNKSSKELQQSIHLMMREY